MKLKGPKDVFNLIFNHRVNKSHHITFDSIINRIIKWRKKLIHYTRFVSYTIQLAKDCIGATNRSL